MRSIRPAIALTEIKKSVQSKQGCLSWAAFLVYNCCMPNMTITRRGRTVEEQRKFNNEQHRIWHSKHPGYGLKYKRKWEAKIRTTPEGRRRLKNKKLWKDFKITIEDYEKLLEKQENKCASCGIDFSYTKQGPCVDHDHTTGKIRGLLCSHCNFGLGMFHDDISKLQKAIEYLVRTD